MKTQCSRSQHLKFESPSAKNSKNTHTKKTRHDATSWSNMGLLWRCSTNGGGSIPSGELHLACVQPWFIHPFVKTLVNWNVKLENDCWTYTNSNIGLCAVTSISRQHHYNQTMIQAQKSISNEKIKKISPIIPWVEKYKWWQRDQKFHTGNWRHDSLVGKEHGVLLECCGLQSHNFGFIMSSPGKYWRGKRGRQRPTWSNLDQIKENLILYPMSNLKVVHIPT